MDAENKNGPLKGLIVIDLTRVLAGPYASMILSDLGARIIKVEPPLGDDSREFNPFVNNQSAYFASLKSSLTFLFKNVLLLRIHVK